jgi:hypothetical protein
MCGVSQAATGPEDHSEVDGEGVVSSLPTNANGSNIVAVGTASCSETPHSDPIQTYLASSLATTDSTQHLDPFRIADHYALVNDSHLGYSHWYTVDSGVVKPS